MNRGIVLLLVGCAAGATVTTLILTGVDGGGRAPLSPGDTIEAITTAGSETDASEPATTVATTLPATTSEPATTPPATIRPFVAATTTVATTLPATTSTLGFFPDS